MHSSRLTGRGLESSRTSTISSASGEGVGLDGAALREAVESSRYDEVIDENRRMASAAGIDAIPAHVFARRFLVLGAQPYDVLKQVVERIGAMPDQ